jgi:hypothetical protein
MLVPTAYSAAAVQFPPMVLQLPETIDLEVVRARSITSAPAIMMPSDSRPADLIPGPLALLPERLVNPSTFWQDENLDWDLAMEVAPRRPSGTLAVTLEFAGRGQPSPIEDPWD